jgi:hypothetical protein
MTDDELLTAVRESFTDVHSATPAAQIVNRGHAMRARRRIPGVAGALTVAAGTALAVTALLPSGHPGPVSSGHPGLVSSGHPGSHPASVRLAAWTVAKQANGDIDVTIHQLQNPAGLQSTLRADGLPANVTFSSAGPSASCQPYATSLDALSTVFQVNTSDGSAFLVIHPSALPRGTGVGIFEEPGAGGPLPAPSPGTPQNGKGSGGWVALMLPGLEAGIHGPLAVGLVDASPQCTGQRIR